jgi:AhpD family alkylhydroperoxidase
VCYHEPADRKYAAHLRRAAPAMQTAYAAFGEAVFKSEDAAIPRKYRELMAIAVGATTQCPFCIDTHVRAAVELGATAEEVSEAVMVASAIRAGGGVTHGFLAMKIFQDATKPAEPAAV